MTIHTPVTRVFTAVAELEAGQCVASWELRELIKLIKLRHTTCEFFGPVLVGDRFEVEVREGETIMTSHHTLPHNYSSDW